METKPHIALVTTWFPPEQSVATNRMLAFVEFLSEHYTISVFALGPKSEVKQWSENVIVHYSKANSVIDKLRSKQSDSRPVHVCKTAIKVILSKITKSPLSRWQREVTKQILVEHLKNPLRLIISSFSPQETHLAVVGFLRIYSEVKWIADMRDEMSMNPTISALHKAQLELVENLVNEYATGITTVSEPILTDFKRICNKVDYFEEVRNGYNHDFKPEYSTNSIFTIGYFGSFYAERKPVIFFQAMEELITEYPNFDFEFHIVGAHKNFDIPLGLKEKVKLFAPMNYDDAIGKMMKMDANLIIQPRNGRVGVFSGKLFDYISVNVPVIALVDKDDVAAQLINEFNAGYVGECNDVEENKMAIWDCYSDWRNENIKRVSEENRISLHRKNQVSNLHLLIQQILASKSN